MIDPAFPEYEQTPPAQTAPAPEQPPVQVVQASAASHSSMKLGIIVGSLIALVMSGGTVYYFTKASEPIPTPSPAQVLRIAPSPSPKPLFLTLEIPSKDTPILDGELLIKGTTLPFTTVAISTGDDDSIIESDAEGAFEDTIFISHNSQDVLTLSAFTEDGEEKAVSYPIRKIE